MSQAGHIGSPRLFQPETTSGATSMCRSGGVPDRTLAGVVVNVSQGIALLQPSRRTEGGDMSAGNGCPGVNSQLAHVCCGVACMSWALVGWDGCWWWAIHLESDSTELVPNTCAVAGKHIYGSQQLGWLGVSLRPQALQDQEILTATSPLQPRTAQRSDQAAAHHKKLPYQIQDGFFPSATVHFSLHKQAGVPAISSEAPSGYTLPAAGNNPLYHALTIRPRISIRTVRPVRPPNHLSMDWHSLARTATPSTAS